MPKKCPYCGSKNFSIRTTHKVCKSTRCNDCKRQKTFYGKKDVKAMQEQLNQKRLRKNVVSRILLGIGLALSIATCAVFLVR